VRLNIERVQHHISKLVNLGLLVRRETGKARGLQVTEKGYEVARALQPRSPKHFSVNSMVLPLTNSIARYGQDVKILPALRLRLLGDIAAGVGIEAHENRDPDSYIEIAPADANAFALHVRGDSMIGDLIHDGDFVVVLPAQTASDGDIVAAWLRDGLSENGEVTIKRYFRREDGRIRLQPSNPNLHPLILPEHEVQVQGIVISVVRPILGMTRRANQ